MLQKVQFIGLYRDDGQAVFKSVRDAASKKKQKNNLLPKESCPMSGTCLTGNEERRRKLVASVHKVAILTEDFQNS